MGPHNLSGCWKKIKIDSSETFINFKHWNSQVCQHCASFYDVNLTILILLLQFEVWRKYRFLLNSNFQHKITTNFVTLKLYSSKRLKKTKVLVFSKLDCDMYIWIFDLRRIFLLVVKICFYSQEKSQVITLFLICLSNQSE